jgi:hypothetical protein
MVFLIDLPHIEDPDQRERNELTLFGAELAHFLSAQGMDEKLIASLRNYDFSKTARYGFIHTMSVPPPVSFPLTSSRAGVWNLSFADIIQRRLSCAGGVMAADRCVGPMRSFH